MTHAFPCFGFKSQGKINGMLSIALPGRELTLCSKVHILSKSIPNFVLVLSLPSCQDCEPWKGGRVGGGEREGVNETRRTQWRSYGRAW